jgi:hypothetical protein
LFLLFVSNLLILSFKYIFPFFFPENSPSVTSYIVQIISIHLVWILQPLQFILLPLS